MIDTKKYIAAFLITLAIFASGFFASNFFNTKKVENMKGLQDSIAIDILSNETQFDLLKEVSCSNINYSYLSDELGELGDKITYTDTSTGFDKDSSLYLRKYYSLLQIKDYLLSKKLGEKCAAKKPVFILYFYSTKEKCADCTRTGYVLTELKKKYPDLRIYSFDYDMALSVVETTKQIFKVKDELPALVIDDTTYTGYKTLPEIENLLPQAFRDAATASSTNATSTVATSTGATSTKTVSAAKKK
jgi:hypothetical protein